MRQNYLASCPVLRLFGGHRIGQTLQYRIAQQVVKLIFYKRNTHLVSDNE